ncbi:MAG: hypothetical protein M3X11_00300, partial [Acidobacteriota bacterium]|nr:hypothetical protein [Acidobacteriota bacterium]
TDGAASVRGKVVLGKESKPPSRLRVHLVPVEPASNPASPPALPALNDDVLRYSETFARADNTFNLTNLAPGKYWLLARAVAEDEPVDRPAQPVAWDAASRAKLRKQAEAAKVEIELKPCQRLTDQTLKYSPATK